MDARLRQLERAALRGGPLDRRRLREARKRYARYRVEEVVITDASRASGVVQARLTGGWRIAAARTTTDERRYLLRRLRSADDYTGTRPVNTVWVSEERLDEIIVARSGDPVGDGILVGDDESEAALEDLRQRVNARLEADGATVPGSY